MALESGTYISDLVVTNPGASDAKSQGDDHLRLLKSTLKATFPNVTGAVTPSHTDLNTVGVTQASGDSSTKTATTAFVAATAFSSALPAQAGNAGKFVTTNGTAASWASIATPSVMRSARTSNTILGTADATTLIDITSGTFTQTFAAAATLGSGWFCYIRNSGTGDITLDPNAAELIDGLTSYVMYPSEVRLVQCDGVALKSLVLNTFYKVFATSGTFAKPPGYSYFSGVLWGGGAGGTGGQAGGGGGSAGAGNSGGLGVAGVPFDVQASLLGAAVTATVGAAGAAGIAGIAPGGAGGAGGTGGTTSFGSFVVGIVGTASDQGAYNSGSAGGTGGVAGNSGAGIGGAGVSASATKGGGGGGGGGSGGNGGSGTGANGAGAASAVAGSGGNGGAGGAGVGGAGVSGSNPGGGGGGGGGGGLNANGGAGGAGGSGELRIWGVV